MIITQVCFVFNTLAVISLSVRTYTTAPHPDKASLSHPLTKHYPITSSNISGANPSLKNASQAP